MDQIIQILAASALGSLLFSAGLRMNWLEIVQSLRRNSILWLLPVNFILAPVLAAALVTWLRVPTLTAAGILLLAAAPFAPVVPIFARLAKADLPLAASLTGLFPFLAAFLTPWICQLSLQSLSVAAPLKFQSLTILLQLVSTITLPLGLGVFFRVRWPRVADRLLKPIQILSEAVGAASLAFVTITEFSMIVSVGWRSLAATVLLSEILFLAGYTLSGPARSARFVAGIGSSNRNLALALLLAAQSFPGTPILASVVANGLLLILLGLVHVGVWRWIHASASARAK